MQSDLGREKCCVCELRSPVLADMCVFVFIIFAKRMKNDFECWNRMQYQKQIHIARAHCEWPKRFKALHHYRHLISWTSSLKGMPVLNNRMRTRNRAQMQATAAAAAAVADAAAIIQASTHSIEPYFKKAVDSAGKGSNRDAILYRVQVCFFFPFFSLSSVCCCVRLLLVFFHLSFTSSSVLVLLLWLLLLLLPFQLQYLKSSYFCLEIICWFYFNISSDWDSLKKKFPNSEFK